MPLDAATALDLKQKFDQLDPDTMSPEELKMHGQLRQMLESQPAVQAAMHESGRLKPPTKPESFTTPNNDPSLMAIPMGLRKLLPSLPRTPSEAITSIYDIPSGGAVSRTINAFRTPANYRAEREQNTPLMAGVRTGLQGVPFGGAASDILEPTAAVAAGRPVTSKENTAAMSGVVQAAAGTGGAKLVGNVIGKTAGAAKRGAIGLVTRFPERLIGSVAKSPSRGGARAVMAREIGTEGPPENLPTENFHKNVVDFWNQQGQTVSRVLASDEAANPGKTVDAEPLIRTPYEKRIAEVNRFARGETTAENQINSLTEQADRRSAAAAEAAGLKPGVNWNEGDPIPMTPNQLHQFTRNWRASVQGGFDRMEPVEQAVVQNMHEAVKQAVPPAASEMQDYHDLSRYKEALDETVPRMQGAEITPPLITTARGMGVREAASSAGWKLKTAYTLNKLTPKGSKYRYVGTYNPARLPAANPATLAGGVAPQISQPQQATAPPVPQINLPGAAGSQAQIQGNQLGATPSPSVATTSLRPPRTFVQPEDIEGNVVPGDSLTSGRMGADVPNQQKLLGAIANAAKAGQHDVAKQLSQVYQQRYGERPNLSNFVKPVVRAPGQPVRPTGNLPTDLAITKAAQSVPTEPEIHPQEAISPEAATKAATGKATPKIDMRKMQATTQRTAVRNLVKPTGGRVSVDDAIKQWKPGSTINAYDPDGKPVVVGEDQQNPGTPKIMSPAEQQARTTVGTSVEEQLRVPKKGEAPPVEDVNATVPTQDVTEAKARPYRPRSPKMRVGTRPTVPTTATTQSTPTPVEVKEGPVRAGGRGVTIKNPLETPGRGAVVPRKMTPEEKAGTKTGAGTQRPPRAGRGFVPTTPIKAAEQQPEPAPVKATQATQATPPTPPTTTPTKTVEELKAAAPEAKKKLGRKATVTHSIPKDDGSTVHVVDNANTPSGKTVIVEPPAHQDFATTQSASAANPFKVGDQVRGIDIAGEEHSGEVVKAGSSPRYGPYIEVKTRNGRRVFTADKAEKLTKTQGE